MKCKYCNDLNPVYFRICHVCKARKDRITWLRKKMKDRRKRKNFYIYLHLDNKGKCIYVGKTSDLRYRQDCHKETSKHFKDVKSVLYANVSNETELHIYEIYYINKLFPKYNITYKYHDDISFMDSVKKLDFKEYILEEFISSGKA